MWSAKISLKSLEKWHRLHSETFSFHTSSVRLRRSCSMEIVQLFELEKRKRPKKNIALLIHVAYRTFRLLKNLLSWFFVPQSCLESFKKIRELLDALALQFEKLKNHHEVQRAASSDSDISSCGEITTLAKKLVIALEMTNFNYKNFQVVHGSRYFNVITSPFISIGNLQQNGC